MKRIEVSRDRGIRERVFRDVFELEQPAAKPVLCATEATLLTRPPVDRAVRQFVRVPRHRYGRLPSKGGQCRQRAIEAVVGAPRNGVPAIVDEVPVVVSSRVGMHEEVALGTAKRILHRRLMGGILKVV